MQRSAFSVLVPAYNEGAYLAEVLERIIATLEPLSARYSTELIVVDDGSTDETPQVLRALAARRPGTIRVVTHQRNQGLNAAMRTACEAARHDIVVVLDADLSYSPEFVEPLVLALLDSDAEAALASPYMPGGSASNVAPSRLIASRVANWLLSRCVRGRLHTLTGMVRAYRAGAFRSLLRREPRGEFNSWAVAALLQEGKRVVEIPADLIWPAARRDQVARLGATALLSRAGLVVSSARALLLARRATALGRTGTLVLGTQPPGPYSVN